MVEAESCEHSDIVEAMAAGRFYASTGVYLDELISRPEEISIRVRPNDNAITATQFVGAGGVVHCEIIGPEPVYRPTGDEGYVRAWVRSSGGGQAWSQPVFLD